MTTAEDYARTIHGMGADEPNEATGIDTRLAFMDTRDAFEAGRREGAETYRKTVLRELRQIPCWIDTEAGTSGFDIGDNPRNEVLEIIRALPTETGTTNA